MDEYPEIPFIEWSQIGPQFLNAWGRPRGEVEAEHVAFVGPTGSGKSYAMTHVLKERAKLRGSHTAVVATKPADKTMTGLRWPIINEWPPKYGQDQVVFWPYRGTELTGDERAAAQRVKVKAMLEELWQPDANMVTVLDEISYIEKELGLRSLVEMYWREARALGITLVATTQRPVAVSRLMFSEPSWVFAFKFTDEDERTRAAEICGNRKRYRDVIESLDGEACEFLLVRRRTGEAVRTIIR